MNIGVQDGLIDPKHEKAMGRAVWLYMWFVQHQTKRNGGAFVLGGMPLTYKEISRRSGWCERVVRCWLDRLRSKNYVRVKYLNFMMMKIEITKAKKWGTKQTEFGFRTVDANTSTVKAAPLTQIRQPPRRETVKGSTQNCQPKQNCSLRPIESTSTPIAEPAAQPAAPVDFIPDWIPLRTWAAYREMRIKIRRPLTPHAVDLIIRKLAEMKATGESVEAVLDQSIMNSWQGIFSTKERSNGIGKGHHRSTGAVAPEPGKEYPRGTKLSTD